MSLDPQVTPANPVEAAAKEQLDALIYDSRGADGKFIGVAGSGAFRIVEWEPGKHATFAANDDFRGGRPFVDTIEIQMGRAARDRMLDLELNKADFAEIPAEQARRASDRGVRISTSQPDELLALVFLPLGAVADPRVREALADSIDRAAIVNFILQKNGEPAGGLLPQWSSGTAFLFPTAPDVARAQELWSQITPAPPLFLGYDSPDLLEENVAERIVVNAREAGIVMSSQPTPPTGAAASSPKTNITAQMVLVRSRMTSPSPRPALAGIMNSLDRITGVEVAPLPDPASPQEIYEREREVLSTHRIVPLVWLPQVYALSGRVRNWKAPATGETWPFADVWLDGPAESQSEKESQ
jgi:peptide/nickel transport system substrate-binding protein